MRVGVIEEIYNLMKKNSDSYFLAGDLGYTAVEKIEKEFPTRFVNVGVAEQNMIGLAAGLALSGKKVYVYSIIPFLTMRCFEQIRDDICFQDLDVTLIGIGAGLSYGYLSSTHFALEDLSIMRVLPNLTIFSPADEVEARLGIQALKNFNHPVYFRIGKRQEPIIYKKPYSFKLGKGVILRKGDDAVIFSTGPIIDEVLKAVDSINKKSKFKVTIINIHTLKPIDTKFILKHSLGKKVVITVEEHSVIGGLGSTIAEVLSQHNNIPLLKFIGTGHEFIKEIGSQSYLRGKLGLSAKGLYKTIISTLKKT